MDPLSIAAAALTAAKGLQIVSEKIYRFVQANKGIDSSVSDLHSQVQGCTKVLEALSITLRQPFLNEVAEENQELWQNMNGSVDSCSQTISRLNDKIEGVKEPESNVMKEAWRQYKLKLKQDEINAFVSSMKTHSLNVQLSVGIVNVLVCGRSPDAITKDSALRFDKLEKMIAAIDFRLGPQDNESNVPTNDRIDTVVIDKHTASLMRSANSVMSMASTVATLSIRSEQEGAVHQSSEPAFEYVNTEGRHGQQFQSEGLSTTGSEHGIPLTNTRRVQIQNWSKEAAQIEEDSEDDSTTNKTQLLHSLFDPSSTLPSEPETTDGLNELFQESSDDDTSYEMVSAILAQAEEHFEHQNFEKAEAYFRLALDESQYFSLEKSNCLNIRNGKFKLAVCCLRMGKLDECEERFLLAAKEPMRIADDAKRTFEALHNLSCVHLLKRNLDTALIHCRQALQGRRRAKSIGKKHEDYVQSVRLLAIILWAKGDEIQAVAHMELLRAAQRLSPSDFQYALENEFPHQLTSDVSKDITEGKAKATNANLEGQMSEDLKLHKQKSPTSSLVTSPVASPLTLPLPIGANPPVIAPLAEAMETKFSGTTKHDQVESVGISALVEKDEIPQDPDEGLITEQKDSVQAAIRGTGKEGPALPDTDTRGPPKIARTLSYDSLPSSEKAEAASKVKKFDASILEASKFELPDLIGTTEIRLSSTAEEKKAALSKIKEKGFSKTGRVVKGLLWAAKVGNIHVLNCLLEQTDYGVNMKESAPWSQRRTPLLIAVENEHLAICMKLISSNADVNATNKAGQTALMLAIKRRHGAICQLLSKNGAYLIVKDHDARYVEDYLVSKDDEKLWHAIIAHTTQRDTALCWAASQGYSDLCLFLLENGAYVDARGYVRNTIVAAPLTLTALMIGAERGYVDICRILIWNRADINAKNSRNATALMIGATAGHIDVCRFLVESGANVDAKNIHHRTALNIAAIRGHVDICRFLVQNGADVNVKSDSQDTALMIGAYNGRTDVCRFLAENGADINAKNERDDTAMMLAARTGRVEICRLLLRYGADVNLCNKSGLTASKGARNPEIKQLLQSHERGSNW